MDNNVPPVFVVGVPRSGTTVFSLKLAEASGIAIAPETHFMPEVYGQLKHLDLGDAPALNEAINKFRSGRWFTDLGLEPGAIEKAFIKGGGRDWPALFATILQLYAHKNGAVRWGEKTPGHYRFVNELLCWYPDCHIIFVMRDPRGVVASNMRAPFSPSYAWFIARRWREMWDIYQPLSSDSRISMVRYEDFVADPAHVMEYLKNRLGVEMKTGSTGPGATAMKASSQGGWRAQHLQIAAGAVTAKSVSRWRRQLSRYDIWVTDQAAGEGPAQCGYEPVNTGNGQWRYRLAFYLRYPVERLELAVGAAMHVKNNNGKSHWLKQRMLLLAGSGLDWAALLRFRAVPAIEGSNSRLRQKRALIVVGGKHRQTSSYVPLTADSEVLGLFVATLCNLDYEVRLAVRTRDQFFAARRIINAFGLANCAAIVRSSVQRVVNSDQVEVYLPGKSKPVHRIDKLEINAINAGDEAARIDALAVPEMAENDVVAIDRDR